MMHSAPRCLSLLLVIMSGFLPACTRAVPQPPAKEAAERNHWVDSVYNKLSEDERIGQLFMVAAYSGGKNFNEDAIETLLRNHQIGGLIFMQGGAGRQANLTNRYQQMAQVPLLLSMDAEWGLGMRLDSIVNLPRQMMIGATRDTALAYLVGTAIAYQCRRIGVHIDFAPVVDVNNNPANPVINFRSFGERKKWVAQLGCAYMRGLQDGGVMACAKHFPGHGDVSVDSHKDLPVITKSRARLDTLELYPFREMIKAGVQSIMVAHLSVPALETEPHVPTTLSKNTVTNLLKNELGFKGLVFTDALDMQGVAKYFEAGEADVRAFIAGNDVLLFSQNVPVAIAKIKAAVKSGRVSNKDLESRVKKILAAKYNAGLAHFKPVNTEHITEDINQYTAALSQKIADAAFTAVHENGILSKLQSKPQKVAYVAVNGTLADAQSATLKNYFGKMTFYNLPAGGAASFESELKQYDAVIIGVHKLALYPANNYGLGESQLAFLQRAQALPNAAIVVLGNAYASKYVCHAKNLFVGYEDTEWTEEAMVKAFTGALTPMGTLPVTPQCMQ